MNITITFSRYSHNSTIMFPPNETVYKEARTWLLEANEQPTESQKREIQQIASRDPLTELHEQDRVLLWQFRIYCSIHVPHILSKLLLCVDWGRREEV